MKKLLAILLCVCLLIPAMGLTAVQSVSADGEYVLADLGYHVNTSGTITGGFLISQGQNFDAIDLTQYGYPTSGIIEPGKLAIQLDTYIAGDAELAPAFSGSAYDGQIEMTSSGTCDVEESTTWTWNSLRFEFGTWHRYTIDLSMFTSTTGGGLDPTDWKYFRIYFNPYNAQKGLNYELKICNVRLVDLTKTAPSLEEDPLGDGSFDVEPPVWEVMDVPDGYNNGDKIVAGYNLVEYIEEHSDIREVQVCLEKNNYAPIIQSLCDGLAAAGGGALYIPSGRYPCKTAIVMKAGVTIYGDWKNPDENPEASGTILEVYAGKGSTNGMPFIGLGSNCLVRYLTFWYPDQGYTTNTITPYSPTVSLSSYAWAQNLTFINSYTAIKNGPSFANCPNAQDIYGTTLFLGLDLDCAIDIARIENINLSPKYWEQSGLAGAPVSDTEKAQFEGYIKFNSVGLNVLRIDWSYITFVNVEGYATGMVFNEGATGASNGQCLNLHFKDCGVGLSVFGAHPCGEMISNSKFENCDYGVWLAEKATNEPTAGLIRLSNVEIDANEYAVYNQNGIMLQLLSSTVKNGTVGATYGWYTIMNTTFASEAPQVVLENGTLSAVLVGCKTAKGGKVTVENEGFCPVVNDPETADVAEIATYTDEEVLKQDRRVANDTLYLVDDLANDGVTDVTAALQAKLNAAKAAGGGIVHLVTGDYLVNGTITIPTGVELRGAFDFGNIGRMHGGSNIYITRTTDLDTPSVIMEAGSGIRGIGFHYPDQTGNTELIQYPYAIQGRGADIYIINVNMHNVWNGVDLMTYRCDNHYVDYVGGQCLNNMVQVGGGSQNGIVRNVQINPGAIDAYWGGSDTPFSGSALDNIYFPYVQNNAVCIRVGHAENQIVYDCFNYSGYVGVQVVPESTGKATLRAVGNGMDATTVAYDIVDAECVDILNTQMCIFNKAGKNLERELRHISLGADNTGVVNVTGALFWELSDVWLNVQGGTLNLYGINDYSGTPTFANISETANLNVAGMYVKNTKLSMACANSDRITINGGYYLDGVGGIKNLVNAENVMKRGTWWGFESSKIDLSATSEVVFSESFNSGYDFQSMTKIDGADKDGNYADGAAQLSVQSGRLQIDLNTNLGSVSTRGEIFEMTTDTAQSTYCYETRLNVASVAANGRIELTFTCSTADLLTPVVITADGILTQDAYGDSSSLLSTLDTQKWYRVQVVFDLCKIGQKTYTVILMDDSKNVIAESEAYAMPEDMQEEGGDFIDFQINGFNLRPVTGTDPTTKMSIDYIVMSRNAGTMGDVDGDGDVDSTDARLTLQYYVGAISEDALNLGTADVDGDGDVDSTDARLILQFYVGAITEF